MTASVAAAISPVQSNWPCGVCARKACKAVGSTCMSSPGATTKGQKNSFHAPMPTRMAKVASGALDSGSTTRRKIMKCVAPSSSAASSSSRGNDRKNCRRKNTEKPDIKANGATMPASELSQPRSRIRMKLGMNSTTPGSIMEPMNSAKSVCRKGKRSRANA